MPNLYKLFFYLTLMSGTIMAISSYSWMGMWMGLEINLLSIIPLMGNSKNQLASESSLKYFITQAIASSALLFSMILMLSSSTMVYMMPSALLIMSSSLLMKMGAAPFHFWFPEVMEGLNWDMSLMMLTWQKIAPMIILMNSIQQTSLIFVSSMWSMLIGGIMGLNQTSLRKILAYSSINHIGWMLSSLTLNYSIWMNYFLIYSFISLNLILMMEKFNLLYMTQMNSIKNPVLKMTFLINFMSMGGVPPFLGFLPKWMVLNELSKVNTTLCITMVILTLITLFFYMRLVMPSLTLNSAETKLSCETKLSPIIWWSNSVNLLSLILCTAWFNLI